MADNVPLPASSVIAAADELTYSGDTAKIQLVRLVHVSGAEGSKTLAEIVDAANALKTTPRRATTGTTTQVSDSATSGQLLAADATRLGFRIFNDSSATLFVKYGTTASTTDYTVRVLPGAWLEENFYTGRVDGIWSSDPNDGAARITALT